VADLTLKHAFLEARAAARRIAIAAAVGVQLVSGPLIRGNRLLW
jgi:hypothetical protein